MPTLIQSISRCMAILEAINLHNGATVADLCRVSGLTRGTVYRILETLRRDGFLRKDEGSACYWLAARVRSLSDGYQDEWWIDGFARDIMTALGAAVRWPVKLLTPSGHEMLTRVTTDFSTPFTDGKYPTGLRIAMPWSAAGRAYLAFCDEGDRETLLKMAVQGEVMPPRPGPYASAAAIRSEGFPVVDTSRAKARGDLPPGLQADLVRIRRDGYALVHTQGAVFFTLAVPVLVAEGPLGAVAVHIFRSVMTPSEAVVAFTAPLQAAAGDIADRFAEARPPAAAGYSEKSSAP